MCVCGVCLSSLFIIIQSNPSCICQFPNLINYHQQTLQYHRNSEGDHTFIELDALVALSLKEKDDTPLEDVFDDKGIVAELLDKN